jgi:hypothetical protein
MSELTATLQALADADHARQPACSRCGKAGEPYEHRGVRFDGLHAVHGERLCTACTEQHLQQTPLLVTEVSHGQARTYDLNPATATEETEPPVQAIAAAYRYADWRPPRRGGKATTVR